MDKRGKRSKIKLQNKLNVTSRSHALRWLSFHIEQYMSQCPGITRLLGLWKYNMPKENHSPNQKTPITNAPQSHMHMNKTEPRSDCVEAKASADPLVERR
jgi:hypothetical protein